MIRPELRAQIIRYREAIAGAGLVGLGLWWAIGSLGLLKWMGVVLALFGAAIAWQGLLRARIRRGSGGVGVVQIDERQVIYLAPAHIPGGGGFASLDLVQEISIARDMSGLPVWRFRTGAELLTIPTSAEGSEALFDALTVLPGIDIPAAIRAVNAAMDGVHTGRSSDRVVIWSRKVVSLH